MRSLWPCIRKLVCCRIRTGEYESWTYPEPVADQSLATVLRLSLKT